MERAVIAKLNRYVKVRIGLHTLRIWLPYQSNLPIYSLGLGPDQDAAVLQLNEQLVVKVSFNIRANQTGHYNLSLSLSFISFNQYSTC